MSKQHFGSFKVTSAARVRVSEGHASFSDGENIHDNTIYGGKWLKLGKGAVVTLDRNAGDPVDIFVNGRLIARGEVLVLNDNFCVRVAELVAGDAVGAA